MQNSRWLFATALISLCVWSAEGATYTVTSSGDTGLPKKKLLSEEEYQKALKEFGRRFKAGMGAEAIRELLRSEDLDALSLDLGATLGYAGEFYIDQNYGSDAGSAFTHAQADAALTFALNEKISVSAKASYSSILEDDVRDDIEAGDVYPDVDIFFGGVNVSYSF